jgi:hypothetical protein
MIRRLGSHLPSHSTVVAYLALFLVLSGGTAVALSGSNTVFSDDITDGNVRNSDLGFRAVTLEKINGNAINSGRVVDNSLTGTDITGIGGGDVTNNSLTGADINESSLSGVGGVWSGQIKNIGDGTNDMYGSLLGTSTASSDFAEHLVVLPPGGATVGKLHVLLQTGVISGDQSRTFTVVGTEGELSCTIDDPGEFECSDTGSLFLTESSLELEVESSGTGLSAADDISPALVVVPAG